LPNASRHGECGGHQARYPPCQRPRDDPENPRACAVFIYTLKIKLIITAPSQNLLLKKNPHSKSNLFLLFSLRTQSLKPF
jgi:hypothetical protein